MSLKYSSYMGGIEYRVKDKSVWYYILYIGIAALWGLLVGYWVYKLYKYFIV